ncbi:hypothetical protein ONZ45_g11667 [Pleurotus djamor]|nr:hypothetical protein ONZ45_g11667 [Pleurotus djamor]
MSSNAIPETPNGHHRPRLPKQTPRTVRSNAGTAGITHVRPEIAAEMDGEVSIVPLASFIEAYLPDKPDDKVVDGFVTQAVKSHLMHRTGKKLRFAKFMTTPTAGKGLEDELYAPLEDIGKAVAAFRWRGHTRNQYDLVPCPKNGIRSQINGSNNKIDGCYKKRSDEKAINAHEIAVVIEEKLDPKLTIQNNLQAASANVQIMNDDPRRMFSFSMTIVRDQVSLWYYSRSHTAVSEPFSFVENPKMFIKVLMSFQFASEEELGFDPLVERQADGTYIFEIRQGKGPPRRFRTVRVLSEYRSNNITGRMSRIWLVREINGDNLDTGKEYVLKDVWLEATAATERAIQTAIFTDFEDFVKGPRSAEQEAVYTAFQNASKYKMRISDLAKDDKFKDYFMTIIADDVCGESKALAADAKAKRGLFDTPVVSSTPTASTSSKKSSQRQPSGTPRPMTTVTNHVPTQHRTYVPRQHYRVVFEEFCTTVGDLETMGEVASVLEHAVTALRVMFCAGWVHRDISSGNVLAFKREGSMLGKVSDLEYARRYPPDATYQAAADPKTGTPYFMPHEILESCFLHNAARVVKVEPVRNFDGLFANLKPTKSTHPRPVQSSPIFNFQHDLESIWWIFLWTATRRVSHEPSRNKFSPVFVNSILHVTKERATCFRQEIQQTLEETLAPSLQGLSEALDNLRSVQVTFYQDREADNKLESPSSYTEVHDLFSAFFRMIISQPEPWASTLLIAPDKDDIGSDIGQPQRVKPPRVSKKRTRDESSQAEAGPSTRDAVDAPSPKRLSRQRTAKNDMPPPSGPVTRSSIKGSTSAKGSIKRNTSAKGSSSKAKRPAKASPVRQSSRGKSKSRA